MNAIVNELIAGTNTVLEGIAKAKLGLDPAETDPVLNRAEAALGQVLAHLKSHPVLKPGMVVLPPPGGKIGTHPADAAAAIADSQAAPQTAAGDSQAPESTADPESTGSTAGKVAALVALFLCLLLPTGCHLNPSTGHVIRVVATGTKLGLSQNPSTGVYELGIQRVQTEVTTVPVFLTNGEFKIPPTVLRYEVNTHSAIFGNAALTSTMATGSNAVATAVGGATPPINNGTGTGNNLPTAPNITAATPAAK